MSYTTGMLKDYVQILNRKETKDGKFGKDSAGVEWEDAGTVPAAVDWARGKQAMNMGSLDVYGVVIVRMRWNCIVNERSRICHEGKTYQILGDTFHSDYQDNAIQFHAQAIINNK